MAQRDHLVRSDNKISVFKKRIGMRHTFAVRALEKSPETRDAVGRQTLALITYMGHACVSDTYWYLDTTPQLMTDIATACETCMQGGTS